MLCTLCIAALGLQLLLVSGIVAVLMLCLKLGIIMTRQNPPASVRYGDVTLRKILNGFGLRINVFVMIFGSLYNLILTSKV